MAHTVKTTTGYGKRVSNSFKGIGVGFIMFILGTILLFWNEGRFVNRQKTINEVQEKAKHIDTEAISEVDSDLDGKLIHASAFADTKDELTDDLFGVKAVAIALNRQVEYYQWVENTHREKRDKLGGGEETTTTYTYKKEWVSGPVNSSAFSDPEYKESNKVLTTVEAKEQMASNVTFGAYKLPKSLVKRIKGNVPVEAAMTEALNKKLGGDVSAPQPATPPAATPAPAPAAAANDAPAAAPAAGGWRPPSESLSPEQPAASYPAPAVDPDAPAAAPATAWRPPSEGLSPASAPAVAAGKVQVSGHVVYIGKDPENPQIGDVRVTLTKVMPADISIIAQVSGKTFEAYTSKATGQDFMELRMGTVSKASMIQSEHTKNTVGVWILRLLGTLLVIGGLKGIFGFITTLAKVVPFLASIVGAGIGLICGVIGFAWSLLVISIAWLFYRPLVGIPLVVAAIALIFYLKKVGAGKKAQPVETE